MYHSFETGQRHGKGKITTPTGFTYEGDWSRGEIEGQGAGTMRYATGEEASGEWTNSALTEDG